MMKNLIWVWLILVTVLLAGCQPSANTRTETAVPPTISSTTETAAAEVVPTDTAVPPQPTNTRPPTTIPPTPQPPATRRPVGTPLSATAVPALPDAPALVWLPYATGNFGQPVLMLEGDTLLYQSLPVDVEIFFDYQPESGWLAYGSKFWGATANQQSVTDLYIYNFATESNQLWADGNVGRTALSPVSPISEQPTVAVAVHNGQAFDLVLKLGPDNDVPLVQDVAPYFSWSPDGSQIAYLRDGDLFVTSVTEDSGNSPIASGVYEGSGWIGDAPLWLGDSGYLLYADNPFTIVAVDGSETIVPLGEDGSSLQGPRPFAMLYAPTTNQLITESAGMFGSSVIVYQFGDGFETAVPVQQIDDAQLAGWYVKNKSVVIVSSGEPTILPLTPPE